MANLGMAFASRCWLFFVYLESSLYYTLLSITPIRRGTN